MEKYCDSFILTFKDNSEPVITTQQVGGEDGHYTTVPAQWLHDATKGRAQFVKKTDDGIEIALHYGDFLELKDKPSFQCRCSTLVRLRTSQYRTLLGVLCYPIKQIDNRIEL